jgi:hypothetical protein
MNTDQDSVPAPVDSAPIPVTPMPAPVPPAPQKPSEDWQSRFSGLQRSLQQVLEQTGWNKLEAIPKRAEVEVWHSSAATLTDVQAQLDALQAAKSAVEVEKTGLVEQLALSGREVTKAHLLAEQAPDLFPFLRYIPAKSTDEEQLAEFQTFRQQLGRVTTPTQPPRAMPPATQPPMSPKGTDTVDLWNQMQAAREAKNDAEYARLKDLWYSAQ